MRRHKLALIIAAILFVIPFFWLKSGQMNLGGDSGRLYFYDPGTYLRLHAFYNYLESSFGSELTYYIYLPYFILLYLLKLILASPTNLISFFNGLTLSVGFFAVYLIVRELLSGETAGTKLKYAGVSSVLAGLFYVLSQLSIYSGWEKPIITFNQVFINPLMAWLILKLLLTQNAGYLAAALLTTLAFSPNFSAVGAPPFFAFYPLTVLFLMSYTVFVRKKAVPWRLLGIGLILFVLLHAYHLANTVNSVLSTSSAYYHDLFSPEGTVGGRNPLSYFIAVATSLKISRIWLSLAQFEDKPYFVLAVLYPLLLVLSFIYNRGKTLLLTGLFFLAAFYFASAVTQSGFYLYKLFFRIPGFAIFRNFHGQWLYVLCFFYALMVGLAIAIVTSRLRRRMARTVLLLCAAVTLGFSFPLISGTVPMPKSAETGISNSFRMDPAFENALQTLRASPVDGKVLLLPLTQPGYQLIQGRDGGYYRGLPPISYLSGKAEFGGYETLRPFQDIFLDAVKNSDLATLEKMMEILNVRWVFYNSDPFIMGSQFSYLYSYISGFLPDNQTEYSAFIRTLPLTDQVDFGTKFHLYQLDSRLLYPHLYLSSGALYTNDETSLLFDSRFHPDMRQAVVPVQEARSTGDPMVLYGAPDDLLSQIHDNTHLHKHMPYVNHPLDDPLYPLVVLREKFDLARQKKDPGGYLDYSLYLLSKRVEEMVHYGKTMRVIRRPWQEPSVTSPATWFSYNSWEASLTRYADSVRYILDWISNTNLSDTDRLLYRLKVNEQLNQHELSLWRSVYALDIPSPDKTYLLAKITALFSRLHGLVNFPHINPDVYTYALAPYADRAGSYEVFFGGRSLGSYGQDILNLRIGRKTVSPVPAAISLDSESPLEATATLPADNLAERAAWENSGAVSRSGETITLLLRHEAGDLSGGAMLRVPEWSPGSTYLISFAADTGGRDFAFSFVENLKTGDTVRKSTPQSLLERRLYTTAPKEYQAIVVAETGSTGGFVKFEPLAQEDNGTLSITDLVIRKVAYPELVFRKESQAAGAAGAEPDITWQEINPTRYALNITGAAKPYYLVFSEAYNANWNLFDPTGDTVSLKAGFFRLAGRAGRMLAGLFVHSGNNTGEVAATYFGGRVREQARQNIILDRHTFDTWGKDTVGRHLQANGYGNAWLVSPSDVGGRRSYTLILELKTQKLFYGVFPVSLVTLIGLGGYCLWLVWRAKH
ncbi:hypothetical protein M1555_02835 [Patescibacteria group bacterium]|nr:hypothetical protein [Patescibacteria group bacterium]